MTGYALASSQLCCNDVSAHEGDYMRYKNLTSYPMICTLERPLLLSNVNKAAPICPSTAGVMLQEGYVESLFCGSFYEPDQQLLWKFVGIFALPELKQRR